MTLLASLIAQLQGGKRLPFVEFMHQALFAPNAGYYSGGLTKLGREGDFVTAPELTPLFGFTLAKQCQLILSELTEGIIFEFGAGSGRLCIDLLTRLNTLNALPHAYHILEVSAHLKSVQKQAIEQSIPHLAHLVSWVDGFEPIPFEGVILANEVLDAMPVRRFLKTEEDLLESYVMVDESGALKEVYEAPFDEFLNTHLAPFYASLPTPYQSEVNCFIDGWLLGCFDMLRRGVVLLLDYGFPAHEYYHPDRVSGTLMCHHQHLAHSNPLVLVGEQDITAHVNFTHVAEASLTAGFHVSGFTNQAAFLLALGILNEVESITDERRRFAATTAVKMLLNPQEMGELFKVMALTKDFDGSLLGFSLQDKRASL